MNQKDKSEEILRNLLKEHYNPKSDVLLDDEHISKIKFNLGTYDLYHGDFQGGLRNFLLEGKKIENINEAGNYLGKLVTLRSVMFCQSPGQTFCETCAGPRLSRFKKGLAIPATDMTSAILAASMAAMHKNTTTTTTIDLDMAIT
jgi:hypothetical protein